MSDQPRVRLQRPNLVVGSITRALAFYVDVLGFSVAFQHGLEPDSYGFSVFDIPREAHGGLCVLSSPTQPRVLALTEVSGVALAPVPHPRRAAVVIDVADPDAVVAGARALGLFVYPEAALKTQDGRLGREIGIVDFDDHLVVIYRITGLA